MLSLVRAELRSNRRRVIAPGLAIVIAVGFVTLTFGATSALRSYLFQAVAAQATLSDVVISPPDSGGDAQIPDTVSQMPPTLADTIARVPGVRHAEPNYGGLVQVSWADGVDTTAISTVPQEPRLRWMRSTTGRLPTGPAEVAVDASTAHDLGLRTGSTLRLIPSIEPGASPATVTVVGVADLGASPTLGGLRTLLASPAAAAAWTGDHPVEVDVLAQPGTAATVLRDRIRAAIGSPLLVRTGPEQAAAEAARLSRGVDVLGGVLLGFAAIALVVATIVIANTFAALFARRLRGLALLRCVGATRRQVFRSVLAETAAIGAAASAVGVLLGVGLTVAGVAVLGRLYPQMAGVSADLAPWMLAIGFAAGLLVALVAGALPARRATRVAPLAALRPDDPDGRRRASRARITLGTGSALIGIAALAGGAGPLGRPFGLLIGIGGGILTLVGVLLLGPLLVPAATRVLGLAVRGWTPGRLAVGNAVRNPARAASTSLALLVGVSLVTMMSVGAASVSAAGDRVVAREFPLDLSVTAAEGTALPAGLDRQLAAVAGTRAALALPGGTVTASGRAASGQAVPNRSASGLPVSGQPVNVVAADPAAFATVWRGGDPALTAGVALVPNDVAHRLGVRDGGTLTLAAAPSDGRRGSSLRVRVHTQAIPQIVLVPADAGRLLADPVPRQVLLRAEPGVDASAYRTRVREQVAGLPGVQIGGAITQGAQIEDAVSVALRVVVGLLGAALVIAVVGIANTLSLGVLERARELAVQRALGMTRRQLRLSLGLEALLLALVGGLLGIGLGIGFGWAGTHALLNGVLHDLPLVVPWGWVGSMALISALAGVLAALLPARRAARTSPVAALAAE